MNRQIFRSLAVVLLGSLLYSTQIFGGGSFPKSDEAAAPKPVRTYTVKKCENTPYSVSIGDDGTVAVLANGQQAQYGKLYCSTDQGGTKRCHSQGINDAGFEVVISPNGDVDLYSVSYSGTEFLAHCK